MQKQRVSALILNRKNAEILLIKRFKEGRNYWVFPGGGVEPEELLEQAIVREVFEETSLRIDNYQEIFSVVNRGRKEHFYLVNVQFFEPKLSLHSPERQTQSSSNRYELTWVKLNDLSKLDLVPVEAKEIVNSLASQARI
ncbi:MULTISPECIES: NUDIX domain-containing protein [Vibrio]|jgi:8-oxo-dGTP pyrophosphatase MutT (NUDIX family)|uniref:NUDIX domain-containing protein n=1 Tax=Vibrio TaxID=662 RepID=UPI00044812FF|nr:MULTISPECIES: NUDIX domain-containing protein [Vibrio]EGQ7830896.1 NUDIX domain-containing protein [Vibrio parahaemolyticus]EGQ8024544.1 NUDIX domain-containing protein [Vibrio vulnificus]EGR0257190.1 NUDIX domain-containing protein [Vibrio parahaemolyticus]EIV8497608.1 NUDIX domain-containing protein [Vibrio vulnificus]EJB0375989.1 NUDIX domain-containing protein [Vibrio parahaemolyticus]